MNGKQVLEGQIELMKKMAIYSEKNNDYNALCMLSESIGRLVQIRDGLKEQKD